jgi:hypothetical protein
MDLPTFAYTCEFISGGFRQPMQSKRPDESTVEVRVNIFSKKISYCVNSEKIGDVDTIAETLYINNDGFKISRKGILHTKFIIEGMGLKYEVFSFPTKFNLFNADYLIVEAESLFPLAHIKNRRILWSFFSRMQINFDDKSDMDLFCLIGSYLQNYHMMHDDEG